MAVVAYVLMSGFQRTRDDMAHVKASLRPARLAVLVTLAAVVGSLSGNSWTAGGADSYPYVTQADLWLRLDLKIPAPIADAVPWPNGLATFTPFGYRAAPNQAALVPATGPGLPLLMALLKSVAGHCAAFLVVPFTGGLLIWATFAIGRRLGSDVIGLGAAWLVATSPTFLMMSKSPMSDVPAAAFWAQATSWALGASLVSAVGAGLSASVAILIRPNLVPLAAVIAAWLALRSYSVRATHKPSHVVGFVAGALPGCLAVAWINNALYGSPLASGYGDLSSLFSFANIPPNLARYTRWLIETQTPLAAIGILALLIPSRRLWPSAESQRGALLLALITLVVWAAYAMYTPFEAWWFLRFLLPCWPAISIGTAAVLVRLLERRTTWSRRVTVVLLFGLGVYDGIVAVRHDVFPRGEGERRYATIAKLVEQATEPSSVILTAQHAGPIRYYAGRLTLRFDLLDPLWLDRAAEWLTRQGRRPYILLEDWERPLFEKRFAAANRLGRLELAPVLAFHAYQILDEVYLFDPLRPDGPTWQPTPLPNPQPTCVLPASPVPLTLAYRP
jgi:hypothetical protein